MGGLYPMMESPSADDCIERFVLELLRTGSMLSTLVPDLADALPPDAYPGEEPVEVIIEMLCGTIATALGTVDSSDVLRATDLIARAGSQTVEHLRLAQALSERIHGDGSGAGRAFG